MPCSDVKFGMTAATWLGFHWLGFHKCAHVCVRHVQLCIITSIRQCCWVASSVCAEHNTTPHHHLITYSTMVHAQCNGNSGRNRAFSIHERLHTSLLCTASAPHIGQLLRPLYLLLVSCCCALYVCIHSLQDTFSSFGNAFFCFRVVSLCAYVLRFFPCYYFIWPSSLSLSRPFFSCQSFLHLCVPHAATANLQFSVMKPLISLNISRIFFHCKMYLFGNDGVCVYDDCTCEVCLCVPVCDQLKFIESAPAMQQWQHSAPNDCTNASVMNEHCAKKHLYNLYIYSCANGAHLAKKLYCLSQKECRQQEIITAKRRMKHEKGGHDGSSVREEKQHTLMSTT